MSHILSQSLVPDQFVNHARILISTGSIRLSIASSHEQSRTVEHISLLLFAKTLTYQVQISNSRFPPSRRSENGSGHVHPVPDLDAAIRIQIWQHYIISQPRIVELTRRIDNQEICTWIPTQSSFPPSPLVSVNREARYEVTRLGKLEL
jgi:hypothetical protein